MATNNTSELCRQLGYAFTQPLLLQRALTHRSYSADHNERLEFLGDSILGCVIAKHFYSEFPQLSEGELSRLRSTLVREETLAILAQKINLSSYLLLGEGERKSGGFSRPSILADAMEALFGAVFMDADFTAAEKIVLDLYMPYLASIDVNTVGKDGKTLLQEYLQGKRLPLPLYSVTTIQGEAHSQLFHVECAIPTLKITAHGEGNSRKSAEQQAALAAYRRIFGEATKKQ